MSFSKMKFKNKRTRICFKEHFMFIFIKNYNTFDSKFGECRNTN